MHLELSPDKTYEYAAYHYKIINPFYYNKMNNQKINSQL